ncbi:hypothetical protein ABCW43_23970 [Neorhizobium sp. IRAMC:178]|uniref:hypothetical protein n=1 Tax=Neorhizobium tunisiense TaxID=3144793 RepID=UPI0031F605D3
MILEDTDAGKTLREPRPDRRNHHGDFAPHLKAYRWRTTRKQENRRKAGFLLE